MKNKYIFFLSIFFLGLFFNFFLPNEPLFDERLFFGEVKAFGADYLPTLDQIRNMNSPMGPVYFIIYGFIGKLVQFSLFWMRSFHLLFSTLLLVIVYESLGLFFKPLMLETHFNLQNNSILSKYKSKALLAFPLLLTILYFLNPYFLLLTGRFLYTDIIGLIFVFSGVYFYLQQKHLLLMSILWGLAICTRQLFIVIPLAAFCTELYHFNKTGKKTTLLDFNRIFKDLSVYSIPFLFFVPLFVLWDFNVNSGNFQGEQFEENTLAAFSFSFKRMNYTFILVSIYACFVSYQEIISAFKKPNWYLVVLTFLLLLLGFPLQVNKDIEYGNLPDTAGILDIILKNMGIFAYIIVPVLLYWGLVFLYQVIRLPNHRSTLFLKLSLLLFILLESIYSYCWDKHFMLVIPIIWILGYELIVIRQKSIT